jgi:hypothetical protein
LLVSLGADEQDFSDYQDRPVEFGREILGDTYTNDVMRMMRSVRDYPITIAKSSNATGKTHAAARVCIWWYKSFRDAQVYCAAAPPEGNLKRLLWGEIADVIEKNPKLFAADEVTTLAVRRAALDFIQGVTIPTSGSESQREAKFSGKHRANLLFVLDEGDAIPDEVYRGIESCMTGGHCRLLIMFNPRSETGEPYRMERDKRANIVHLSAFKHPNVIKGEEIIPGAVTQETVARRINQWCRPLVPDEDTVSDTFDLPDFMDGVVSHSQSGEAYPPLKAGRYEIKEPAFSYMVLGRYPAQAVNQLISREWTTKARQRYDNYVRQFGKRPMPGIPAIMGLDAAEFGIDANCAIFRYGGFVEHPITWTGVDMLVTGDRASDEYLKRRVAICNVDATGVGAGVAPHMRRLSCDAQSVKVAESPTQEIELGSFRILRDQLWWACREWLRTDPGAMLPPDDELLEDLHVATYEKDQRGFYDVHSDYFRDEDDEDDYDDYNDDVVDKVTGY